MSLLPYLSDFTQHSLIKHIECLNFANYIHLKMYSRYERLLKKYENRKISGNSIYLRFKKDFDKIVEPVLSDNFKLQNGKKYIIENYTKGFVYITKYIIESEYIELKSVYPYLLLHHDTIYITYKVTAKAVTDYTIYVRVPLCYHTNGYIKRYPSKEQFIYKYIDASKAGNYVNKIEDLYTQAVALNKDINNTAYELGIVNNEFRDANVVYSRYSSDDVKVRSEE